ncbi:MAG: hypothetical protein ACYDB4_19355 [Candidatus Dormibacteraceae bacterium]
MRRAAGAKVTREQRERNLRKAKELFSRALDTLATHPGTLKARLAPAYRNVGALPDLPGMRAAPIIEELHKRMTAVPAHDNEGAIGASVEAMSEEEAVECARDIIAITWQLHGL